MNKSAPLPMAEEEMARRSTPQRVLDEGWFPIRVRVMVPNGGFGGRYDAIRGWLSEHATAAGFFSTFPDIELADFRPPQVFVQVRAIIE